MKNRPAFYRVLPSNFSPYRILAALLICFGLAAVLSAQDGESFESPTPVLLSDKNSGYALAVSADNWRGTLPRGTTDTFQPGQRVVVFVTNLDLLPDEGANAFRIFAHDAAGKRYRLSVEGLSKPSSPSNVYALTLRIFDPNTYNGQPAADSDLKLTISWRGNVSNPVQLLLGKRVRRQENISVTGLRPQSPNAPTAGDLNTFDRKRFMEQATFGPTTRLDSHLRRVGFRSWINEQFAIAYPTIPYPNYPQIDDLVAACGGQQGTSPEVDFCIRSRFGATSNQNWFMLEALYGDDQLRRRVSWTLHSIWVVAHTTGMQREEQEYIEILDRNAFGNYRDLMYEMTLSPAMGRYLDMINSTRFNPNENYPRELLQLFTVGLYMLNQDGTLILDNQGNRIPTYDQDKINQFTKIFTGWTACNNGLIPPCSNAVAGYVNYIDPMYLSNPNNHDLTAKNLFNYSGAQNSTIAACPNCTTDDTRRAYATDSLNKTLDNIFNHPNVGPFVGKLLIQHLVTSDPTPAYVARVATAFNNNGAGVRGDMKAVIKATLLDPEARGSQKTDPTYGKLREPLQYITNFLRTFGARAGLPFVFDGVLISPPASCANRSDGDYTYPLSTMGQQILIPNSVFSYFPPDYVVPGTDVLGPEFALANTGSSIARNNLILNLSFAHLGGYEPATATNPYPVRPCGISLDRSEPIAWATADATGNTLIEGLNVRMMHGTMSEAMKSKIRAAIINVNAAPAEKAGQALFLVASSSQYQVQR